MQAAAEVARLAGTIALRHFRDATLLHIEIKDDGSPVTRADREAEACARDWIEARFPQDGMMGEEGSPIRVNAPRRWIIDPIDGTSSFIRGVPLWGTLVALASGDEIIAGAAYCPATDDLVAAAPGEGCWWNGTRCRVSAVTTLTEATVLTTDDQFRRMPERRESWRALAAEAAVSRTWGDCYGYVMVATGRAEVMADAVVAAWDAAPFVPIIEEAGGVFTDWDGRRTAFGGSMIATNAGVADATRALLGAGSAGPRNQRTQSA